MCLRAIWSANLGEGTLEYGYVSMSLTRHRICWPLEEFSGQKNWEVCVVSVCVWCVVSVVCVCGEWCGECGVVVWCGECGVVCVWCVVW